jgi:hypothetical protein
MDRPWNSGIILSKQLHLQVKKAGSFRPSIRQWQDIFAMRLLQALMRPATTIQCAIPSEYGANITSDAVFIHIINSLASKQLAI